MTGERWRVIESLFHQAVELEPGARAGWLDRVTAGDPELRAELVRLLGADEGARAALDAAVQDAVQSTTRSGLLEAGSKAGPYEIVREIGRGGIGAVYLARRADDVFQKQVAIKVVKRGMDTEAILRRFYHERRILARLEHPYIVRIIDGGSTGDGLPYLVMEYVEGSSITDFCEEAGLSVRDRLRMFRKVCEAVQYAHQNFVVHRDPLTADCNGIEHVWENTG
jgi:serine/threonine protein kinase